MKSPRRLLLLFLVITLLPAALLLVLGWRMLGQNNELQLRQEAERRAQLVDLAGASLRQSLEAMVLRLESPDSITPAVDSVVVEFLSGSVRGKLLFYPFSVVGDEAPDVAFAEGEQLEIHGNSERAAAWYATLAQSRDSAIRAGALIRQARALQKVGRKAASIVLLDRAAEIRGPSIRSVPVDLFARWMACSLVSGPQRQSRANSLHADLMSGKWHLSRPVFELHEADAAQWAGEQISRPSSQELALAAAAEWLWNLHPGAPGYRSSTFLQRQITVIWWTDGVRIASLIAGPDYVREQWLANLPGIQLLAPDQALARSGVSEPVRRHASETGLPWTLVMPAPPPTYANTGLWLIGLGLLVLLVVAGTYFVARAADRELKVAGLQADFVAAVSHEFRTPLTTLQQFSEVLRDGRVQSEDRRQIYYDAIARQTDRLNQLVESLLDFGRMEAGRSPYRLMPLDAHAWVSSVVEEFGRESAVLGFQIDFTWSANVVTIMADPPALTNALWNLLENAVKYSPECRTVWVSADRESRRLAVRVTDRGLGIPSREQKDIFRKFVRGAQAKQLGIRGTGIGLAIVEHIIKAHGGEITLESEPGMGSTFTVSLPCHES